RPRPARCTSRSARMASGSRASASSGAAIGGRDERCRPRDVCRRRAASRAGGKRATVLEMADRFWYARLRRVIVRPRFIGATDPDARDRASRRLADGADHRMLRHRGGDHPRKALDAAGEAGPAEAHRRVCARLDAAQRARAGASAAAASKLAARADPRGRPREPRAAARRGARAYRGQRPARRARARAVSEPAAYDRVDQPAAGPSRHRGRHDQGLFVDHGGGRRQCGVARRGHLRSADHDGRGPFRRDPRADRPSVSARARRRARREDGEGGVEVSRDASDERIRVPLRGARGDAAAAPQGLSGPGPHVMQLKTRPRDEPDVNLTSLIDVVLLLLIFFMVSTSFVREAEINLRLPEASATELSEAPSDALEITVTESGAYLVNGRPLVNSERRTLRAAIERLIGEERNVPVYIRADANATHQAVVTAMD